MRNEWICDYFELTKIQFPLCRNTLTSGEFLRTKFFPDYLEMVSKIDTLNEAYADIKYLCNAIIEVFKYSSEETSKKILFKCLDELDNRLFSTYIENIDDGKRDCYYRLCKLFRDATPTCKEMLHIPHIPVEKKEKASSCRYSIKGEPCSYMSTMAALTWYESKCPSSFYLAKYYIDNNQHKKHKLLRLDIRPHLFYRIDNGWDRKAMTEERALKFARNACCTLPLIAACSLSVQDENIKHQEEYVIPQLLMEWVKTRTDYIGIKYNTAKTEDYALMLGAYNIALPTKKIDIDGYCKILKEIFITNKSRVTRIINNQSEEIQPYDLRFAITKWGSNFIDGNLLTKI